MMIYIQIHHDEYRHILYENKHDIAHTIDVLFPIGNEITIDKNTLLVGYEIRPRTVKINGKDQ